VSVPIGPIRDPGTLESLISAAERERDPAVLADLIGVLGPSDEFTERIAPMLVELARSESEGVRAAAIRALAASPPEDDRVILALIEDASLPLPARIELVSGLAQSRQAVTHLSSILRNADEVSLKVAAVRALGVCWDKYARIEVLEVLRGNDVREVRMEALAILGGKSSDENRQVLKEISESDTDPKIRSEAARILRHGEKAPEEPEEER
jgi:HEAT repeat protein